MVSHDDGSGKKVYACGSFVAADANPAGSVVRWNGASWQPVGTSGPTAYGMTSIATGANAGLYTGGKTNGWPTFSAYVRKWNGAAWTPFGLPFDAEIRTLSSFDFGTGPTAVAGGAFVHVAGGPQVNGVARWNGTAWAPLGTGIGGAGATVHATAVYDDGTGPALHAAGLFATAGGVPASSIAKWDGNAWVPLGSGITGGQATVYELEVYDDGSGPSLYAAGKFDTAGGITASNVAKWNGTSWSALGGGVSGGASSVFSLEAFDDGTGSKLYVGGNFQTAGGSPVKRLAAWDGSSWADVYGGVSRVPAEPLAESAIEVQNMLAFDDGVGASSLFVAGYLNHAGGVRSHNVAVLASGRPRLTISQVAGPGSGVVILNANLKVGSEYCNVFSLEPSPFGPGTGPYLGLWATDVALLIAQVLAPIGTLPFHFVATGTGAAFGVYQGFPGLVVEGVCFDFSGGTLGCVSTVPRLVIQ
jgi:trimeric autotransporter adhesin